MADFVYFIQVETKTICNGWTLAHDKKRGFSLINQATKWAEKNLKGKEWRLSPQKFTLKQWENRDKEIKFFPH